MYQDQRLENAVAWIESQQQAEAEQWYLQEAFEEALERHPDLDPQELADNSENFGWDFDATADALRDYYEESQAAPQTISDAVDAFVAGQRNS